MPTLNSFDFATIRVVPRVDREEFVNAGVILFCLERKFLEALVHLDETRLQALSPGIEVGEVRMHLEAIPRICAGGAEAGPLGKLSARERFHWLVAPRSTVIQVSPVHTGLCDAPEIQIAELFRKFVLL